MLVYYIAIVLVICVKSGSRHGPAERGAGIILATKGNNHLMGYSAAAIPKGELIDGL